MAMSLPPVGSSRPPSDSLEKLDLTRIKTTQDKLGQGDFGSVYDYDYGRSVIKIANDNEKSRKMLEKEYSMYKLLEDTESFPKIKSDGADGAGYLIMEKLDDTLFSLIEGGEYKKVYFYHMVNAVKKCHDKRVCHHDITSENFMKIRTSHQIKLLDFGLSHMFNEKIIATPKNIAVGLSRPPEILVDFNCNGEHDIFMLGRCLFELEGRPPFYNTHDCKWWIAFKENKDKFWKWNKQQGVNPLPDFKVLFEGMMNPNPEERFNIHQVIASEYYESCVGVFDKFIEDQKAYRGASAASPFKKHKKRKSNKRVRGQRTSRRKAKRGSARARRVKTAL